MPIARRLAPAAAPAPAVVALDFETHLFAPGDMAPRIVCLSAAWPNGWPTVEGHEGARQRFVTLLENGSHMVWHNAAYDMACALYNWPDLAPRIFAAYREGRIHCTRVREMLLDIARLGHTKGRSYSLADIVARQTGRELDKTTWRTGYGELDGVPLEQWPTGAVEYAKTDAVEARALYERQAVHEALIPSAAAEAFAAFCLHLATVRGIYTDSAEVARLRAQVDAELDGALRTLQPTGLIAPVMKGRGSKRAPTGEYKRVVKLAERYAEQLAAERGVSLPRTPTGRVQLTDDSVETLADETLTAFVTLGRAKGLHAEVERLAKGTLLPLHPAYNTPMETGRTSSGGGVSGINIQNRRRAPGYREVFKARAGHALIAVDYSHIELNALAQVCLHHLGYSRLGEAINAGRDPHLVTAASFAGVDYETALARHGERDKQIKSLRDMAKAFNFGLPGGLAEDKFIGFAQATYRVTIAPSRWNVLGGEWRTVRPEDAPTTVKVAALPDDVQRDIERAGAALPPNGGPLRVLTRWLYQHYGMLAVEPGTFGDLQIGWFRAYPEIRDYFKFVRDLPSTPDGLRVTQLYSNRIRSACSYCAACNSHFQGLAADGAKRAITLLTEEMWTARRSPLYRSNVVAFVHDEIIAEIPLDRLHDAADRMATVMVDGMNHYLPDVPCKVSPPVAMLNWSKAAERTLDVAGRLTPWTP